MGSIIVHPGRHGTGERTTFGFITDDYPFLHKIQNGISALSAVIAACAIVLSGILTLVEVVMRSFFSSPLGWNIGFAERYLMIAIAFFGVVTAYRAGAHIAVATLYGKFPPIGQKLLLLATELICAATFLLLMWAGLQATSFSISIAEQIPPGMAELAWPSWTWRIMVPIASGLGLIVVLIDIFRELTTPWTAAHTDYEPGEEN